jgi:hypothetical protein
MMRRAANPTRVAGPAAAATGGGNEYVEANSDSEGEFVHEQVNVEQAAVEAQQAMSLQEGLTAADLEIAEHLNPEQFRRAKTVCLDISFMATPLQLATSPDKRRWQVKPHLTKNFKDNLAVVNRHLAGEDDLAGNLKRCVPLDLVLTREANTLPFFAGLKCEGLMPVTVHRDGECLHRVAPGTLPHKIKERVFDPVNIVDEWMYTNYRMCTLEDLESDVVIMEKTARNPARGLVTVGSLAYKQLTDSLAKGCWKEEHAALDLARIFQPNSDITVEVTPKMASQIKQYLRPRIEDSARRFIDLDNLIFELVRADEHREFDCPKGLHGEIVGNQLLMDEKRSATVNSAPLSRTGMFLTKAYFTYILF